MDEVVLAGGIANAGKVLRRGDEVIRPSAPNQVTLDRYLSALRVEGFETIPEPLGPEDAKRARYRYIEGDVPFPPYPSWALTDEALASVGRLLRRFHDVSERVDVPEAIWSDELRDPRGGSMVIHNDLCPENTIFRDGEAVAMIDFDFAAPGDPLWDLAGVARMWGTIGDPAHGRADGAALDPARLAVVTRSYGLDPGRAEALLDTLLLRDTVGRAFLQRHVEAGESAFVQMWTEAGGAVRRDRERTWLEENRSVLLAAVRLGETYRTPGLVARGRVAP